ncbi:MAG: putative murein hydrolase (TIGR00659 family) [Cocleimonas sp.]|jgi:predicted murein hydrolase (TIGR00659 family)
MQKTDLQTLWVYLSTSPLTGLTITLIAYLVAHTIHQKARMHPLTNTVLISVILLIIALKVTNTDYATYFEGAKFIHFLLGPVTVALAIPLIQQFTQVKKLLIPILVSMTLGIIVGTFSVLFIAKLLGADLVTQLSLSARSVTAPVAMGISEKIGGLPSLTAVLAVITGIIGAVFGIQILKLLKIKENSIKGIAMGNSAHGIGTARAFTLNNEMGAFAGLAMAIAALLNALLIPWLVGLYLILI